MFARARYVVTAFLLLFFSVSAGLAQQYGPQQERRAFAQQELDQMLAPIALYPDALLSQILMAATYPVEVGEAARWSRANSDLLGDRAVRAAERMDWDPSVQSLVAFPQILAMMDEKQEWTEDLGDAFLDQQAQVMDTVQYLRQKANEAGNLRSTDQYRVDSQGSTFSITMSNPEIVYLPYYNPLIVYGTWWWPTYQPVYWAPWPGYYSRPGIARGYAWGPGIRVSRGFFFGAPDWSRRSVHVVNANAFYYRPARRQAEFPRGNASASAVGVWQHDMSRGRDNPRRDWAPRRDAASRPDTGRTSAAPGARQETNTTRELGQSGRDTRDGRDGRGTRQSTERVPGNAVVPSPSQPAANAAPVPARVPPVASRPNAEQRPDGANARTGSSRNAEGRGSVTREPDASPGDVRGWSRNRGDGRTDAGGRSEERGNAPRAVPNAAAPQNVERAPAAARAPVAVTHPPVAAVPVQQNAPPAVVNRPNNEQRPSHDNAGQRGEQRSSGPREHAAPPAASNDNQGSPPGSSRR